MYDVPKEVVYRYAFRKAAEYFAEKLESKRKSGLVAILVEGAYETMYYMPCDEMGYPNSYRTMTLELPSLTVKSFSDFKEPPYEMMTCYQVEIRVERPLLSQSFGSTGYPHVFMWSGRRMGEDRVPIEKLNVKELMVAAQNAVRSREGLVINEALKNKIYK